MRKRLISFWKNYKFRFVPWLLLNLKEKKISNKSISNLTNRSNHEGNCKSEISADSPHELSNRASDNMRNPLIVHHVRKRDDKLISDEQVIQILLELFSKLLEFKDCEYKNVEDVSKKNLEVMERVMGYSIKRKKSLVSSDAGTGVFLESGYAKPGSLIALYPGTIYMPSEPLFFPFIGNPFIFRCSDGVHIDGNDKWLSKSIFKSCATRDKFGMDLPCCDDTWLTTFPFNPLNIGQYVNNRSKSSINNVVYQESALSIEAPGKGAFPVQLAKFLPNVWANPGNNNHPLRLVPLIAVKGIGEGEEILSSYFTMVHSEEK